VAEAGLSYDLTSFRVWQVAFVGGGAHSGPVLFLAGLVGSATAAGLAMAQRILTPPETLKAWLLGMRAMIPALCILVLALTIRVVTEDLETARFVVSLLHGMDAVWLPLLVFLLAAAVAFATGTSWGTMGILLPVAVPLVYHQLAAAGQGDAAGPLLLLATGAVLDGAIFGDHCSPISDTTVLSSIASGADHIHHVRTQVPYAMSSMAAAGGAGYLLVGWSGWSPLVGYAIGTGALLLLILAIGRRP
jgi:Na+/H+ antiporter NhaC